MNRFWERLVKVTAPFSGSPVEADRNVDAHNWRVIRLHDRYPEAQESWPPVVSCVDCGVLADSEASKYPCGAAPEPVPVRFLKRT